MGADADGGYSNRCGGNQYLSRCGLPLNGACFRSKWYEPRGADHAAAAAEGGQVGGGGGGGVGGGSDGEAPLRLQVAS